MLRVELFDYDLPEELIAQRPPERRDASRMLVLDRTSGACEIRPFTAIAEYLEPGDVMIFNDTRVIRGRMFARKNGNPEGAKFELLLLGRTGGDPRRWKAMLKPGKRAAAGTFAALLDAAGRINGHGDGFTVIGRLDDAFEIEFSAADTDRIQALYGHMPLPPYIHRTDEPADAERYQTVFARAPGAAAAPTAGLHFTPEILAALAVKGVHCRAVTLHVGAGTFKPVSAVNVEEHRMHAEEYELTTETAELVNAARASGRRVLAVGTTSVRVLESCADAGGHVTAGRGATEIFLYPPYRPRSVDLLLTNFHLPKSTLLMLVSTFAPRETVLSAYQLAIAEKMRFFSYGDCMLLK
jgi:S-adenosylmethionine:tRNA ribosyltransferase-isomerase